MTAPSSIQTLWTPHPESAQVQRFKTLLEQCAGVWVWVSEPQGAGWIVIDATMALGQALEALPSAGFKARKIALAHKLTDLPDGSWVFCQQPVTANGVTLIVKHLLRMRVDVGRQTAAPTQHLPRAQAAPSEPQVQSRGDTPPAQSLPERQGAPWRGNYLRLKRWPNLSRYQDPQMRLLAATRKMLMGYVPHEELTAFVGDAQMLDRLLADTHKGGTLQIRSDGGGASGGVVRSDSAGPSLFQRFLNKFQ
ncbi:MAG: hypothetical protein COX57_07270 [Alphaproteobacteria bacterium CG_4_10_14_0_2_um_filter_63_37]|nr:MAG: hypothetical protein AUJ55_02075 [Proteobacteria bacterium CG1_02_64_396]PJA24675.1 MAG: hypothetical protein COX57_07270 [Alphaproteobacteria bacterium CG_4_10_14_0_2_um_filter_63_37]